MGYGWNTRSPEDVQRINGRAYDFKKIAERYEDITPLRGKRKAQDIRPHGERSRCWERIVKVSDNEYYLTNNAYRYFDKYDYTSCRAITFKRDDEGNETLIVHTPRQYWGDDKQRLIPRQLGISSTFYFYAYNLPEDVSMYKFHSKSYLQVKVEDGYGESALRFYTLDKGDVTLTRQVGQKYFKPLIVHREFKRYLDRGKTKALRDEMKEFAEYVRVMLPLAEMDRQGMWQSPVNYATIPDLNLYNKTPLSDEISGKGWRYLFAGEPKEVWFKMVQYYKHKCNRQSWNSEARGYDDFPPTPQQVIKHIHNEVYRCEKPLREEPVELGVRTYDKYKSWYE